MEAAQKGATLAAFSETWLPGYPFFQATPAHTSHSPAHGEYLASAVEIPSPTTDRLCEAAYEAGIDVVIGISERDSRTRGTVYCTLLFIGREGVILGRHRKLKPTFGERTVWGEGDGLGLTAYERPYGRISGLNCWEHAMVLPGYALMAQGTQIHISAWPTTGVIRGDTPWKGLLLSQAFAVQGSCYVMVPCALLGPDNIPERYRDMVDDGWNAGEVGSCIISPSGDVIAAAPVREETIVTATVSLEAVYQAKSVIDVGGHYSRPDVLQLQVNKRPLERLVYPGDPNAGHANLQSENDDGQKIEKEDTRNL